MSPLAQRIVFGSFLAGVALVLCWLDVNAGTPDGLWLFPALVVLVFFSGNEIVALCRGAGVAPLAWLVHLGNFLTISATWGMALFWQRWEAAHPDRLVRSWDIAAVSSMAAMMALAGTVFLAFLVEMQRYRRPGSANINVAGTVYAVCYIGLLANFLVQLRMAFGMEALASFLMIVKLGDTGAFAVGKFLGRHRMAPQLSPKKTIEGAVGAVVFGVTGAFVAFYWLLPLFGLETIRPRWQVCLLYGVLLAIVGMIGDLAESLIKRDAQQKDSSRLLPGLGGALDLIDSSLMAAPVAYLFWLFGWLQR
ncbi:Phosphatidate cytidylyltransferase [Thermogutta terrifontis]|jgi:phosphatidate cytidylyltransferase|uniref:Phosphatidate cytidylyltransferase n=1 Tax=Thermogutta terrifontis TaxID=1331910 RepID=A0A286RBW4_9BACT|nr:phosphatidate cytidylyltransferase [Thermogutta terrifontis]ASV73435.1 Phosphatidate cytidylyltransferase [Thermogutta terrifontis]